MDLSPLNLSNFLLNLFSFLGFPQPFMAVNGTEFMLCMRIVTFICSLHPDNSLGAPCSRRSPCWAMSLQYLGRIVPPCAQKQTGCEINGRKCPACGEEIQLLDVESPARHCKSCRGKCLWWWMEEGQGEGSDAGSFGCLLALFWNFSSSFLRDTPWFPSPQGLFPLWKRLHPAWSPLSPALPPTLHLPTRLCISPSSHMPLGIPQGRKLSPSGTCCKNTSQLGCNAVLALFRITTSPAKWERCVLEP